MGNGIFLCVDDDITVLNALRVILADTFDGGHTVEIAESAEEALGICQELKDEGKELSVIISDFIMPNMNGDELLVRLHSVSPRTVKIMLTGQSDLQGVKRAINEANLYRFLEKPFNNSDMMLTAKSALQAYNRERELEKRNMELEMANIMLEQKVKERTFELNKSLNIVKEDLALAKKIQKNILRIKPSLLNDLHIEVNYCPMTEVGGDFYDITRLNDFIYRVFLADATGHGVQAAMITMAIKGIYDNIKNFDLDTIQIMEIFNNDCINKYEELSCLMTAVLIDIDISRKKLCCVSAGHPAGVLLRKGELSLLNSTGKMVGILKDARYKSSEFDFTSGDRLYIFTDGIFEEFNSKREEFGEERLHSLLVKNQELPIDQVFQKILNELDAFLEGKGRQDDLTILGIEY
ncbi:MAG TPA: fused response regulator/phosphatase [Leptospiraceae bacterium]|nr:fused response regulator/phosphatase [Leptospiraceae bacterium]